MDMSNKSLALLLVAAIVISLGGTIISLNKITGTDITGRATGAGEVNVTVTSLASCVVLSNVNFGSGTPTTTRNFTTDADNTFDGFSCDATTPGTGDCYGLVVNNTGNVRLNISMNSTKNGTGLLGIGHTEADFEFAVDDTELEADSCQGEITTWRNVNVTNGNNNSNICAHLNYSDTTDVIVIDFAVKVNQNTAPGEKNATITIGCQDST